MKSGISLLHYFVLVLNITDRWRLSISNNVLMFNVYECNNVLNNLVILNHKPFSGRFNY